MQGDVVAALAGTGAMGLVYAWCICVALRRPRSFGQYPRDVVGMVANGLIGIGGTLMYSANMTMSGRVSSIREAVRSDCVGSECDETLRALQTYQLLSTLRFVCWYLEFGVTFLHIAYFSHRGCTMTLLRYATHSVNVALSASSLYYVSDAGFPSAFIAGSSRLAPVVTQSLILVWVLMSYWFIYNSKLHTSPTLLCHHSVEIRMAACSVAPAKP